MSVKIEHSDLSRPVYERLKEMILKNELKPGTKIVQEKIASDLGVSRTPLLKALQSLEHEFLVESIPRRGMFVRKLDLDEIIDTFECREVLEGIAARRCAQRLSPDELATLKSIFEEFVGSSKIDQKKYQIADQVFHNSIIRFSENKILTKLEILNNIIHRTYNQGLVRPPAETLAEHLAIITAIEQGDAKNAENLTRRHLRKSIQTIKKSIKAIKN